MHENLDVIKTGDRVKVNEHCIMYEKLDAIKTGDKVKVIKMAEDDIVIGLISIGSIGTFVGIDTDIKSCCINFDGIGIYYVDINMIEKIKD